MMPADHSLQNTTILDLAPTILKFFGITPPAYMSGRTLEELCCSELACGQPAASPPSEAIALTQAQ
jgi:hypothetical protein